MMSIFFRRMFIQLFCVLCLLTILPAHIYAEELLPENFTKKISLQPAITKIIEDDELLQALGKLNSLHGEMALEGWVLFNVMEYIDDGDFEGFFVTYVKSKERD